ncbi:hypothetical protein D3C87_63910 [compost metagenome]
MKIAFIFSAATALLLAVSCNSNNDKRKSFDEVVEYNDYIVDRINGMDSVYMLALDAESGIDACMKKCEDLVKFCDKTEQDFKGIQPFKGDSSLTMQALQYTQFMRNNGKKEIKALLGLIEDFQEEEAAGEVPSDEIVAQIQETAGKIDERYDEEINKLDEVQKKFSIKHNFTVNTRR